jgi:hypothetical protein
MLFKGSNNPVQMYRSFAITGNYRRRSVNSEFSCFNCNSLFAPLWRMGPRCSSAETHFVTRSYIIAARRSHVFFFFSRYLCLFSNTDPSGGKTRCPRRTSSPYLRKDTSHVTHIVKDKQPLPPTRHQPCYSYNQYLLDVDVDTIFGDLRREWLHRRWKTFSKNYHI